MNCLLRKAKNFEWSFKMSLILVYKNFVINYWIILFKKFYLDKLKFRVKFYLDRIRFYLINERKRERWKVAIDMSWLASLWIVKFKRSIYTCRHSIRRSHYKHVSCLHPIEEVYIHEWCHYEKSKKEQKAKRIYGTLERIGTLSRSNCDVLG